MSQFFPSHGKSIGASASVSVLPINIQDLLPLGVTGLISLLHFVTNWNTLHSVVYLVFVIQHILVNLP